MQVILEGLSAPIKLEHTPSLSYSSLKSHLINTHQIDLNTFSVYLSGRLLTDESMLVDSEYSQTDYLVLRVQGRVLGGKGGFGSQLKAIGAQIQKTSSQEACRDLSGRRVRDVNAEKRFHQLAREEKRRVEERREQQARRREKRWAQRTTRPKLEDPVYYQSLEDNEQRVSAALKHAQQMNGKRVRDSQVSENKRPFFRGIGDLTDSESDQETEDSVSCVRIRSDNATESLNCISEVAPVTTTSPEPTNSYSKSVTNTNTEKLICYETTPTLIEIHSSEAPAPSLTTEVESTAIPLPSHVTEVHEPAEPIPVPVPSVPDPIDLDTISSKQDLEKFSLEVLKITLMSLGLKCGGTLLERIERLYIYKVTPKDQLHPSIFAGKGRSGKKLDNK